MKYLKVFILALLSLGAFEVSAQCGAALSEDDHVHIQRSQVRMRSFNANITRGIRDFPIKAHVVTRTDGTGGFNRASLLAAVEKLNESYINANIRFVLLKGINYVSSDKHYDFSSAYENDFCGQWDEKNVINMYFFGSVKKQGTEVCGYSYYPNKSSAMQGRDRIILRNSCVDGGGSTLIHEVGHFFSLYHTHGSSLVGPEKELVTRDRSLRNCEKAGDGLCDTPADPMIINKVNGRCEYTGTDVDARGERYKPDPNNIMAYSVEGCRIKLTKQQYARANYAALNMRTYIRMPQNAQMESMPELATNTTRPPENSSSTQTSTSGTTTVVTKPPTKPVTTVKSNVLSGEVMLEISGRPVSIATDGNLFRPTEPFYSGTNYQVYLNNNDIGFVYVIGSDLTKKNALLFPLPHQTAYLEHSNTKLALPGAGSMYQMDDTKGKDYLCVLYSKRPIRMDLVMEEIEKMDGNFMQRLYQVLWHQLVPENKIMYSSNQGRLMFVADAGDKSIVPIVVEIDHQ